MSRSSTSVDTLALTYRALRNCELFRDWPDIAVDRVAEIARLERYERFTPVLSDDWQLRELLVVVSGCLEISGLNAIGAKFVLNLFGPGEIVGLIRLLKEAHFVYHYNAHQDTVLVHLPRDELRNILDDAPLL